MALSETFPPANIAPHKTRSPKARPRAERIPITARELLEWTYAVNKAHKGVGESAVCSLSQTGIVIERLLLGCSIDTSPSGKGSWGAIHCDAEALTVHGIVETLPRRPRQLLIDYAALRSVPDWDPLIMPLRKVDVPGRKGQPKGIYTRRRRIATETTFEGDWPSRDVERAEHAAWMRQRQQWEAQGVRHDWQPWPMLRCAEEVIAGARERYRAWYEALWSLCDALEADGPRSLSRYRITNLGAAYEPWRA